VLKKAKIYTKGENRNMKPLAHHTDFNTVEALIGLSYESLQMLSRSMLHEWQTTLYATILKAQRLSRGGLDEENVADEITITTVRGETEMQVHTGFVSEFQLAGKNGWQLWLSDGREWIYHNDHDETENDQLIWVEINREQVKVYEDED
jgi:hypothetical protein